MADKDSTQDTASDVYCVTSDYTARDPTQISLEAGDTVTVLEAVSDEWWWVEFIDKNDKPLVGYAPVNHLSKEIPLDEEDKWENSEYFSSYGQLKLHSEMLTDVPRTSTYSLAIQSALPWLQDKVVLDVGSGTGILSLFCARYGKPKKVYAVEASDIAVYSRETVSKNGYEDVIEVIQGNINDISLPHHQVDWIISEWMGTLLLFEFMIESVINARDKFLKPDGMIWPSEAELFLIPCSALSAYNGSMGIWKDVYGFDFSPYLSLAADTLTGKPIYNHTLSPDECLSEPFTILQLNMKTVTVSQLEDIRTAYDFLVKRSGMLHGFASYFTVHFSHLPHPHTPVTLSTSPQSLLTGNKTSSCLIHLFS
ncbi:PREDICTED: protein arginine N-methyltransferase 2-like isoform X2 [Amphimedon queenslandica]|uniref:SH3 domain-containing protein n=1 Tax=Amphimedon queenslandica TaxID=400682 RepID=A0AAN0JE70_AMPQE|nr:PREDICTED: protein arginine N-methyltransferase 2-like isoform X2 [Amphimedon queenslandica]|eukprot:XP_019855305.1 PREDICTED: protein arginine N-methyltransferase 2-like isoform X2 [Amphimedon queenslandica]